MVQKFSLRNKITKKASGGDLASLLLKRKFTMKNNSPRETPSTESFGQTKYYAYMLYCADHTIYSGYTTDLERRVATHNKGKGAKYTRSRLPVKVVYSECFATKSEAMKREASLKKLSHGEKLCLISQKNESD